MNEIQPYAAQMVPADAMYMPVVDVKKAVERRAMLKSFTEQVMVDERDYGVIPGTSDKKVLLKPGAEKLASFLGLIPDFGIQERILDFDGAEHNGEALLYYRVRCDLYRSGVKVGSGDASCSSRETKYRWRKADRVCPKCGQPTIFRSKKDNEGWFCWASKGGCGAQFKKGDKSIEEQDTRRIPNPDIADLDNTILKMAEKRALIAAVLICTNMSDYFTQDLEDFDTYGVAVEPTKKNGNGAPTSPPPDEQNFYPDEQPAKKNGNGKAAAAPAPVSDETFKHLHALGRELNGDLWDERRPAAVKWASSNRVTSSKELTETEAGYLVTKLQERLDELERQAAAEEAAPTVHG